MYLTSAFISFALLLNAYCNGEENLGSLFLGYSCPRTDEELKEVEASSGRTREICEKKCVLERAEWRKHNQTTDEYMYAYERYNDCYLGCVDLLVMYSVETLDKSIIALAAASSIIFLSATDIRIYSKRCRKPCDKATAALDDSSEVSGFSLPTSNICQSKYTIIKGVLEMTFCSFPLPRSEFLPRRGIYSFVERWEQRVCREKIILKTLTKTMAV
ncbi:hypothetical protein D918_09112 [Trichuris suis]|nr:hypothetical protein D918_09112 [Trichuris suis]